MHVLPFTVHTIPYFLVQGASIAVRIAPLLEALNPPIFLLTENGKTQKSYPQIFKYLKYPITKGWADTAAHPCMMIEMIFWLKIGMISHPDNNVFVEPGITLMISV